MKDMDLQNLMTGLVSTQKKMTDATSYCGQLAQEVLKAETKQFHRTGLHYVSDGLVAVYLCDIDDRMYTVKITPNKE